MNDLIASGAMMAALGIAFVMVKRAVKSYRENGNKLNGDVIADTLEAGIAEVEKKKKI